MHILPLQMLLGLLSSSSVLCFVPYSSTYSPFWLLTPCSHLQHWLQALVVLYHTYSQIIHQDFRRHTYFSCSTEPRTGFPSFLINCSLFLVDCIFLVIQTLLQKHLPGSPRQNVTIHSLFPINRSLFYASNYGQFLFSFLLWYKKPILIPFRLHSFSPWWN